MLKGHPKGLFVLALANMGERFGYYTMLAILYSLSRPSLVSIRMHPAKYFLIS
jgi:hypothetical protein